MATNTKWHLTAALVALGATSAPARPQTPAAPDRVAARAALLARLRFPLPAGLDRVPLFCPDDVADDAPFTLRIGARLYRTDLEDVEENAPGTEVFTLLAGGTIERTRDGVEQRIELCGVPLTIGYAGLAPAGDASTGDASAGDAPIGRLRPARADDRVAPELQRLGYRPGPHVTVRFAGLFPADAAGAAAFREFALGQLIPELTRAPSARPAARLPRWPTPSERTLAGYASLRRESRPTREPVLNEPEPMLAEHLGFFRARGTEEQRCPEQGAVFERLVERFLGGLRWPFPAVAGLARFVGGDDGYGRPGFYPHRALDLGSRLVDAEGNFLVWPAGTRVFPLHTDVDRPAGTVTLREGEHLLRVEVRAFHVRPDPSDGPASRRPRAAGIGTLEPFDDRAPFGGWRTADPYLRLIGAPKGNHIHATVRGIQEGDDAARAAFMRERVLPAWLAAPGPAEAAAVPPVPPAPPGDGSDEDHDPRGAALLRALRREIKRRIQPLCTRGRLEVIARNLPPVDDNAGPWRLEFAPADAAVLRPPVPGAAITRDGDVLVQTVSSTLAERTLRLDLRIEGAALEGAVLRPVRDVIVVEVRGAMPEASAWVQTHLLEALTR